MYLMIGKLPFTLVGPLWYQRSLALLDFNLC